MKLIPLTQGKFAKVSDHRNPERPPTKNSELRDLISEFSCPSEVKKNGSKSLEKYLSEFM